MMRGWNILSILLLFYAVSLMTLLLDVRRRDVTKKKILQVAGILLASATAVTIVVSVFGRDAYTKFYIFLVQLPIYCVFSILSRFQGIKLLFTLLSVIALCAMPLQFAMIVAIVSKNNMMGLVGTFALTCAVMLFLVYKFLRPNFVYIMKFGETRDFWKFSLIPFLYYIHVYLVTGYNFTQYTNLEEILTRFTTHVIVYAAYILLVDIFKNTNEKQLLKNEQAMTAAKMEAADRQIEFLEQTQEQTRLYRHDMRHHLTLLYGFLKAGEVQKALDYLEQTQSGMEMSVLTRYCENNTVNLILSSFEAKARAQGVTLSTEVVLPRQLPIPESELCAVLSNGLENAITAAAQLTDLPTKKVVLRCKISKNHLLIYVQNPYRGTVVLENGMPRCEREGHGFGTKSMWAIAEKRKGYCACETVDGLFILRVVLPAAARAAAVSAAAT